MTTCPRCLGSHRGPRNAEGIHLEASRTLARAAEMTIADARLWLRTNLLRLGLELSDWCPNCTLLAQSAIAGAIDDRTLVALHAADAELPPNVLPFRRDRSLRPPVADVRTEPEVP